MNTYQLDQVCHFSKSQDRWGEFGNMTGGFPLRISRSLLIPSVENLYQSIRFTDQPEIQQLVLNQKSGYGSKLIAKKYRSKSRSDFDQIKIDVMRWCLLIKLAQHKRYRDLLLATDNQPIVEVSHKDRFWGTILTDGQLVGENMLGQLHMEMRELVKTDQYSKIIPSPNIPNLKIQGNVIDVLTLTNTPKYKTFDF